MNLNSVICWFLIHSSIDGCHNQGEQKEDDCNIRKYVLDNLKTNAEYAVRKQASLRSQIIELILATVSHTLLFWEDVAQIGVGPS